MTQCIRVMMINSTAVESIHFKYSQENAECCCWSIRSSNFQHKSSFSKVQLMQKETKTLVFIFLEQDLMIRFYTVTILCE